ncbi:MAG TPA: Hsp20/alpha crystallin family protein [Burkholderiales bacterium]|nr:Hsp20/alpha crystallin family protein [Burkholderiales bacterium]
MADVRRYDPFQELDDMMRGLVFRPVRVATPQIQSIRIDASEDDSAYRISAEIPGVSKDDIHVSINGAELTISAQTESQKEEKQGERVIHRERQFGSMSRSLTLPQPVDESGAQAKYENGVLTLTLPKMSASRFKKIIVT